MKGKSDSQQPTTLIAQLRQAQFLAQELDSPGTAADIERVLAKSDTLLEEEAEYIEQLSDCLRSSCAALLEQTAVIKNSATQLDNHTQNSLRAAQLLSYSLHRMFLREIKIIDNQTARLNRWSQWESDLLEASKQAVWKLFSQTDWPLMTLPVVSQTPFIQKLNRQVALTLKQTIERQAIKIQTEIQQELARTLQRLLPFATTYDQLLQHINTQLAALDKKGPLETVWPRYDPDQKQRQYQATLDRLYTFEQEPGDASAGKLSWGNYDSEKLQERFKGALNVLQTGELDADAEQNSLALPEGQLASPTTNTAETLSGATPSVHKLGQRWHKYNQENAVYAETQTVTEMETAVAAGALGNALELNALYTRLLHLEPAFDANAATPPQRQYQTAVLAAIETSLKQKQTQSQQQLTTHIQQQFNLLKNELDQMIDPLQKWFKNFYQENLGYDPVRLQQIRSQINQLQ
ncbi:MAG: hypothetical protein GY796_05475 [Chloroflexi bacterium]|nr:hypothetical protein [Chloroflexota bacterium]